MMIFIFPIIYPCLTFSHMGRHTADYSTDRQSFSSDTGLTKNIELMLLNRYVNRHNGNNCNSCYLEITV